MTKTTERTPRPRLAHPRLLLGALALAVSLGAPTLAAACSLDGIASLSIDDTLATRTTDAPTTATLGRWAPFTFGLPYTTEYNLRFHEDLGKVGRSLPAEALVTPFRWNFGDSRTASGLQALHRYHQPGWYKVTVQSYWPSRHTWLLFDSAQVHIVSSSVARKASLGGPLGPTLAFLPAILACGGAGAAGLLGWRTYTTTRGRPSDRA